MAKKSEKAREKRISATEASRSFSRLLDQIEAGRKFLVHRRDQDVCIMTSPPVHGRKASECLRLLHARSPVVLDDKFSKDLKSILAEEKLEKRPEWGS